MSDGQGSTVSHPPTERFDAAVTLARTLHADQARKGTKVAYLSHLLGVASLVMEYGGDEDQVIAALLHDAVEDAGGAPTEAAIRDQFGDRVADIVRACSDTDVMPKPPWEERKRAYLEHLVGVDDTTLLVSLADKVHNARSLASDLSVHGDALWDRFHASSEQSHWYYDSLADIYAERLGETALVAELRSAIARTWGDAGAAR